MAGADIGKFTIKAAEDNRTLDKCVHFRPKCNFLNMNEIATLWENKIGRILPRVTITEDVLLDVAAGKNILLFTLISIRFYMTLLSLQSHHR